MKHCVKYQNQDNNTRKAFVLTIKKDNAALNRLAAVGEKTRTPDNSLIFQEFGFIFGKCVVGKILLQFFINIMNTGTVEKVLTKGKMIEQKSDFAYWQSKGYAQRLAALEEIRREYNDWKYSDAEQRFQRVYRVVKLKQS